ncbi:MAG: hypothetical protein WAW77_03190, partial [Caldibacillus thermoamylovorans]|uniref:hypothetical protein n=1 Tax=Caldibacillus thermoamylovorans TaxID=35841 RepID=UPI0020422CA8
PISSLFMARAIDCPTHCRKGIKWVANLCIFNCISLHFSIAKYSYTLQSMTISDTVYSGTPYYVSMYVSDGNTNQIYYDFKSDKKFLSETSLIKWFPKMYKPNNSAVVLYSDYYSAGVKQGSRVEIYSIFQY